MSKREDALTGKAGEALVAAELLRRHIDVAYPAYDAGVDLIAYKAHQFERVVPIQVKASAGTRFVFQKSWFQIKGLVLIHVWRVTTSPEFYVFSELAQVEEALGPKYVQSPSWKVHGGYSVTEINSEHLNRMRSHQSQWKRISDML